MGHWVTYVEAERLLGKERSSLNRAVREAVTVRFVARQLDVALLLWTATGCVPRPARAI